MAAGDRADGEAVRLPPRRGDQRQWTSPGRAGLDLDSIAKKIRTQKKTEEEEEVHNYYPLFYLYRVNCTSMFITYLLDDRMKTAPGGFQLSMQKAV